MRAFDHLARVALALGYPTPPCKQGLFYISNSFLLSLYFRRNSYISKSKHKLTLANVNRGMNGFRKDTLLDLRSSEKIIYALGVNFL